MAGATTEFSAQLFETELRRICKDLVWKNTNESMKYEENTDYYMVDKYVSSARKLLMKYSNHTLKDIPEETDEQFAITLQDTPLEYREAMQFLHDYQEFNDYYRTLNGQPSINDNNYIFINNEEDIDPYTPIHELSQGDRFKLDARGVISKLIAQYPDKEYLKHLTTRKIPPYMARMGNRFDLLYVAVTDPTNLGMDFKEIYQRARDYIVRVYYTESFRMNNDVYEGFIGMCILFSTIQQMHYMYLDADITREFYDIDSLRVVYESYGVPFYPNIPLEYHQRIIKNINRLLSYKGSNQVFFDLCALFDYDAMQIYEYYLLKEHRTNVEKIPQFYYNADGTLDKRRTYLIKFVKANSSEDPYLQITNRANHIDYDDVIDRDKYWVNDEDLLNQLYESEYNYIETKYIGVQLMFSITKLLYESAYYLKMLSDNRKSTSRLYVNHDYIGKKIPLFDMVLYVYAAICKKNGYEGNIPRNPEQVARVYGFNFKDDLTKIRDDVIKNSFIDKELVNFIRDMNISDLDSVHKVFSNIKKLHQFIETKMLETHNIDVFQAYSELRKTLLTTELIPDVFRKKDGTIADSYLDLLSDVNYSLYSRLTTGDINLTTEINHCLVILKKLSSELKYLEYVDSLDIDIIVEYLYKMLAFFKSAKAELTDFNVIFTIDSRMMNLLKLIVEFEKIQHINFWPKERFNQLYTDIFKFQVNSVIDERSFAFELRQFMLECIHKNFHKDDQVIIDKLITIVVNVFESLHSNVVMPLDDIKSLGVTATVAASNMLPHTKLVKITEKYMEEP